jgi:cytochrome P450
MPDTTSNLKPGTLPPSQPAGLFGGHLRKFWRDRTGFLIEQAKLGDVTYIRMGNQSMYFINHPDHIRDMLVVNADKLKKGRALQRSKVLLGNGLLTSEHEYHLRQRRMMQPAFHRSRIAEYSRSMVDHATRTADEWRDGDIRDIDREMVNLTLRIVGKTLFNADVVDDADKIGAALNTMVELFNFLLLPFSEWLEKLPLPHSKRFHRARKDLDEIVYAIIDERRRSGKDEGDLLSMLLAARDEADGSAMTDEQVRDEALTLFLAGHETTANALTWTWYLLSQNQECEEKLHEELRTVLGKREPAFDNIPSLKYTEAVLAESMRLYPPAWAIGRSAVEEHSFGGYRVPVGSVVLMSPFVLHRDPRFWQNPLRFDPDRWLEVSVKEAGQQYVYTPFGGGVRRCIGEGFAWTEGILLIATLAKKWKLRIVDGQRVDVRPQITLRPKYGMKMSISAAK